MALKTSVIYRELEIGTKEKLLKVKFLCLRGKATVPNVLDISMLFRETQRKDLKGNVMVEGGGRGEASVTNVLEISFLSCTRQKMLQLSRSQYNTRYSTFSS